MDDTGANVKVGYVGNCFSSDSKSRLMLRCTKEDSEILQGT